MPLDPKKLDKPLLKLRRLVRKISKVPTQDEVHDLRTNTRRAEATLQALQLDCKRKGRRVLRALTPMRKKAGEVRDMDVLTGFASRLSSGSHAQCLVRILEHLGEKRARGARRLHKTVAKRSKTASKLLKRCSSLVEKNFNKRTSNKRTSKLQKEWPVNTSAAALHISQELANWPRLSAENLHPFRLKVKQMRYVLQLSGQDDELTERLGEVKDQIGEWHDWSELGAIAKEAVSECKNCKVIAQIEQTAKRKFEIALGSAQRLRGTYFEHKSKKRRGSRNKAGIEQPVLQATAALAA